MKKERVIANINRALERIRPYLQEDGGDVSLVELTEELDVKIKLLGACHECQFSEHTLQNGVEHYIRQEAPQVRNIISV